MRPFRIIFVPLQLYIIRSSSHINPGYLKSKNYFCRNSVVYELSKLMSYLNFMVIFFLSDFLVSYSTLASFNLASFWYQLVAILNFCTLDFDNFILQVDFSEFSRFYEFVFFVCRENGQKNISKIPSLDLDIKICISFLT